MSTLLELCKSLEQTPIAASVRQSLWLFPLLEILHLLGMVAVLGAIAAFDLRLLGWLMPRQRVSELAPRIFPWVWTGFALQVVTGGLLFSSEAAHMVLNPAFRIKMLLLLLAGANALLFQLTVFPGVAAWDQDRILPLRARLAGAVSLMCWIGVVAAGRMIGFI